MTKQHFISLADNIRHANATAERFGGPPVFSFTAIQTLADFCAAHNGNFKRDRWFDYIDGKCGSGGGKVKQTASA